MAKPELGTKRICPDTGRKFYDLNKDPVVSPYTGKSFPLSFFEDTDMPKVLEKADEEEVAEVDGENSDVEIVSLEDADEEKGAKDEELPDLDDDSDVELDDDDSDTFLEADDDEDDDMSDLIGGRPEDEEET